MNHISACNHPILSRRVCQSHSQGRHSCCPACSTYSVHRSTDVTCPTCRPGAQAVAVEQRRSCSSTQQLIRAGPTTSRPHSQQAADGRGDAKAEVRCQDRRQKYPAVTVPKRAEGTGSRWLEHQGARLAELALFLHAFVSEWCASFARVSLTSFGNCVPALTPAQA